MIFVCLKDSSMFLNGYGLTEDFERCMFFNSVAVALSTLEQFCSCNDFEIQDFNMFVKCEVY